MYWDLLDFWLINTWLLEKMTCNYGISEAFCPFGGLETLFNYGRSGTFVSHTHLSNVVLLIAVLYPHFAQVSFCG
jgi:hypothetical protein